MGDFGAGEPDVPEIVIAHPLKLLHRSLLDPPGSVGGDPSSEFGLQERRPGWRCCSLRRCGRSRNRAHNDLRQKNRRCAMSRRLPAPPAATPQLKSGDLTVGLKFAPTGPDAVPLEAGAVSARPAAESFDVSLICS
jgi:hypothetical protein